MAKPKLYLHIPSLPQKSYEYRRGDSILVYDENKKAVLIDGGEGDFFENQKSFMKKNGIQHVCFINTHWHQDHDNGLKAALRDPYIIVDEIYAPDPEELLLVQKDCGYDEYKRAKKILDYAHELKKKVVFTAPDKKTGHWVGKIRIWMWRQKANPNDTVDYQVNNTSMQIYFPDLEHLEGGDMINNERFLRKYPSWRITTFSLWHHGNACNYTSCAALNERPYVPKLAYYSDWEPSGVTMGGTTFSKYGAGRAKQYFTLLKPFDDIYAEADGEGHVKWTQGTNSVTYDIDYGAEFRPEPVEEPIPEPEIPQGENMPKLRDMSVLYGPDVSEHQGNIDWDKLAPHIDFAIIRCGYGQDRTDQDDKKFKRNVEACERLGIPYGLYLYSYAGNTTRAIGEAEHMIRCLGMCNPSLPPYYDLEENSLGEAAMGNMSVWGNKVESTGHWAGVYTFESYYNKFLYGVNRYTKWIAKFNKNDGKMHTPPNVPDVTMWQYTSRASLPGIKGNVDMSVLYKDLIKEVTGKDYIQAAKDVWAGKYDKEPDRSAKLKEEGFDPRIVQHLVNRMKA